MVSGDLFLYDVRKLPDDVWRSFTWNLSFPVMFYSLWKDVQQSFLETVEAFHMLFSKDPSWWFEIFQMLFNKDSSWCLKIFRMIFKKVSSWLLKSFMDVQRSFIVIFDDLSHEVQGSFFMIVEDLAHDALRGFLVIFVVLSHEDQGNSLWCLEIFYMMPWNISSWWSTKLSQCPVDFLMMTRKLHCFQYCVISCFRRSVHAPSLNMEW